MKATEAKLLAFLQKSPQFVIPIYQRTYSWTEPECRQLVEDILRTGSDDAISAHFMGSIVYIEKGLYQVSHQSPLLVIDGQQRLTTVMLIIEALARHLGTAEPIEGFSARKLRAYYLLNDLEAGERRYKLVLTQTDKTTLQALVEQKTPPEEDGSIRLLENFEFFSKRFAEMGDDVDALCKGLAKLVIVDISLSREQDNPQLIFESMNSTGRELTQADLIRNYVLMGLEPHHQDRLYDEHWRPMELRFGQGGYGQHFDSFMRHYLTLKTGDIPKVSQVYEAFKVHARDVAAVGQDIDSLVEEVGIFAKHYCAMALGKESNPALGAVFADLRELRVDVAYPMLLEVYDDYMSGMLTVEEVEAIARLVDAYVFRRAVSSIPTNSLNKTFSRFMRSVDKSRYVESVKAHFQSMRSYRRFPSDEEFHRELQTRDLYNFPRRSYWLRRLENYGRKELVPVNEYTIEHIMPQNPNLSAAWRESLGPDWKAVHEAKLHTLGNLTLTGYNSEYSDHPFQVKRDMPGGSAQSPLQLNQNLGAVERWDATAMDARAERLARLAAEVWSSPALHSSILETYQPSENTPSSYSIEDHPHLRPGAMMRATFDALRSEILALDPCVSEEFLKLYVAYKAETNFVDIVPQAKALRLTLNLAFADINDPKNIAIDVSNKGRWGNGDVEVKLKSTEEIPYVLGLIRQSLERQMSEEP